MPWFWQGVLLLIFCVPVIVLFAYAVWDIIRRGDTNLAMKAVWLIVFCVVPIIGPLVYLVIRPPGTTAMQKADAATVAEELTNLADLHERGKLSDHEYDLAKSRTVGVDLGVVDPTNVREQRRSNV